MLDLVDFSSLIKMTGSQFSSRIEEQSSPNLSSKRGNRLFCGLESIRNDTGSSFLFKCGCLRVELAIFTFDNNWYFFTARACPTRQPDKTTISQLCSTNHIGRYNTTLGHMDYYFISFHSIMTMYMTRTMVRRYCLLEWHLG
jgi:hypothetical protein